MAKKELPEINASSMADIAFLLLTFFLIATSMDSSDALMTKLPTKDAPDLEIKLNKRNVFNVLMNSNGQLLVENEPMDFSKLKDAAKDHINNNGDGSCTWCIGGKRDANLSENPSKSVISLQNDRGTKYADYIAVFNELTKAYNELRNDYSERKFGIKFTELNEDDPEQKAMKKVVKEKYPKVLSEAEPRKNNF